MVGRRYRFAQLPCGIRYIQVAARSYRSCQATRCADSESGKEIYGPAHNAVLQIPGTDEWRIVYHRINKWYLKDGPGVHREVCIDRMEFNEDGTIRPVVPTFDLMM